jgi:hypothetical protein
MKTAVGSRQVGSGQLSWWTGLGIAFYPVGIIAFAFFLFGLGGRAQEKPAAPAEKVPVISEGTLHRFWHAAYSLDQAQTQLQKAQDEFSAVRQEIDAACGNFVVNINPRTSEPTCGGPRMGPGPTPAPKKPLDTKDK